MYRDLAASVHAFTLQCCPLKGKACQLLSVILQLTLLGEMSMPSRIVAVKLVTNHHNAVNPNSAENLSFSLWGI